ncbi:hypothetical protein ACFVU3_00550 [Streptomyces sp. NPDC058052]|uniref:hypothetical protein n=1 Tax=Streptomyces sp. NPDC058052 TaxID=3346316 RepID=UPI0036E5B63B
MTQPHAVRRQRATDRANRHTTLRTLLDRLDRLTPADADRLRDCVLTDLAEAEDLRRTISGQTRTVEEMNGRIAAADQAIREVEQERDAARADLDQVRADAQLLLDNGAKAINEQNWARHHAEERAKKAEAAIARVRAECDRIESAVNDNPTNGDLIGGYLACLRHIRAALDSTT